MGVRGTRGVRGFAFLLGLALVLAPRAGDALEALDGRVQAHGFGEVVVRTISDNFNQNWDVTQWQELLNLELEFDVLPDGWGPISALSAYARVEVRFDCIWTHGCGDLAPNVNAYGNRTDKVPQYLSDAHESPFSGTAFIGVDPKNRLRWREDFTSEYQPSQRLLLAEQAGPLAGLFETKGPDQADDRGKGKGPYNLDDDPARLYFEGLAKYSVTIRKVPGTVDGNGSQIIIGWKPDDKAHPIGLLRNKPNPFSPLERNLSTKTPYPYSALPYRPAPIYPHGSGDIPITEARGLWVPSPGLQHFLGRDKFSPVQQNHTQDELQWNRGSSQQDQKELKEAYVDAEFLDGRLWIRGGLQTIVWGKTELFRSQDQFNPQDLALSTLPSLEESRIALWALRGVYSFYDVGPFEDVRLELAVLLDDYEPADLGQCGEPYTPLPVCSIKTGLIAHGVTGLGLAGTDRPRNWWDNISNAEYGGRLEFRWRRFSFAITDYWGYDDMPHAEPLFTYERNVDPRTGRPRSGNSRGGCDPEGLFDGDTSACLGSTQAEVLHNMSGNLQLYATACAGTTGYTNLIPVLATECGFTIFGSQADAGELSPAFNGVPVAPLINAVIGGSSFLWGIAIGLADPGNIVVPTLSAAVPLNTQDVPGPPKGVFHKDGTPVLGSIAVGWLPFNDTLSAQQQALWGCGPFFASNCDSQGLDLFNGEASALMQSIPGFDGTPTYGFTTLEGPQPGTVGFQGGPVCTRFENGTQYILPGCRGPEDPGWDPAVDGNPVVDPLRLASDFAAFNLVSGAIGTPCPAAVPGARLIHPYTCKPFRSEMAVTSYNFMLLLIMFSTDLNNDGPDVDEFDFDNPMRTDGCSFAAPQYCRVLKGFIGAAGNQNRTILAGGNGQYGRRDFLWHGAQELYLRYEKRNVLGFSMDFAEDVSKTNWSIEFTWVEGTPSTDTAKPQGFTKTDNYNLTISVDRPTFINFLNANRTFFFNSQVFFRYEPEWEKSFTGNGPWNILGTFTILTGFFQDRLNWASTVVYDLKSDSGAILPSVSYRFTEAFSAQFGLAFFWGRYQARDQAFYPPVVGQNVGRGAYRQFVENGLAVVRTRDEAFVRLRWTF